MFTSRFVTLAVLAASSVSLTINTPTNWKGNTTNVVTWTSTSSDPSLFTIELVNPQFNPNIGVANNVQTSLGSVGVPLPRLIAGDNFVLQFVGVSDINDILAQSSPFTITENDVDGLSSTASQTSISAASTAPGTPGAPVSTTASAPATSNTAPPASTAPTASSGVTGASSASLSPSTSAPASSPSTGGAAPVTISGGLVVALVGLTIFAN